MNFEKYLNPNINSYLNLLTRYKKLNLCGLNPLGKLIYLFQVAKKNKILFITSTNQQALKYKNDINKLTQINSSVFPVQSISFYEGINPNFFEYSEQVRILRDNNELIIAPVKSLLEQFPNKDFFDNNSFLIKKNNEIDITSLLNLLVKFGYKRKTMTTDCGEFSVRGDIIDIYPLYSHPIRIELWGETVSDIRFFSPDTQKSIKKIDEFKIEPLHKFILDNVSKERLICEVKNSKSSDIVKKIVLEKIEEEGYFQGIDYFQNILNPHLVSLFEYLKDYIIVFDESSEIFSKYEIIDKTYSENYKEIIDNKINIPIPRLNHIRYSEFKKNIAGNLQLYFDNFILADNIYTQEFESNFLPIFSLDIDKMLDFIEEKRKENYKIIIATDYPKRVKEILDEKELPIGENYSDISLISSLSLGGAQIKELKLLILTDKELFNKKSNEITVKKKASVKEDQEYINSLNDIKVGDYVVHNIHGIGIYQGLTKENINGEIKDYLSILYDKGDKLYMPAEQINLLCRYRGSGGHKPKVSRMGGNDWENIKRKVKNAVDSIAYDLVNLYAKRKISKGFQFLPDSAWQYELEDSFEFTETPDQMKAILETKSDMEQDKPMDRLICGDVGFGKTEVAMRAIFKAVLSSKQVALIVPTTILAFQHYQTIFERFKPYPVRVELLSRFKTKKEQKEIIKKLSTGECDVVIGTHRLVQDDIKFKDLGLVVIDEEHRFGVRHKEKLKTLKENIDIITMSATPIPRTLYMSLSGIKDMSIINTPPQNRLPIKTYVGESNDETLKNAINYELNRDGQVFILYNKVETIEQFASKIRMLIPNARVAVGHAKMEDKLLEKVMVDFLEHEYDILICTTIIESGLDIKNANTMIIMDSDNFGLAQLYQIRGRVGRSDKQGYCYCFYKQNKILSSDARARLDAIREFTTLGSGYQIAMRDIEIRGVGNILGTKQHGNMVNVGFDTYCEILDESVKELQNIKIEKITPAIIDINLSAYIPDEWVGNKEQKMIEYKRLADVKTFEEMDLLENEYKDRFSRLPNEVKNLISLIKLRISATNVNIKLLRETEDNIRIYTDYNEFEWKILSRKIDNQILKKIKYTVAPKTCKDGNSVLLFKHKFMSFEQIYSTLNNLFYQMSKAKTEYLKDT